MLFTFVLATNHEKLWKETFWLRYLCKERASCIIAEEKRYSSQVPATVPSFPSPSPLYSAQEYNWSRWTFRVSGQQNGGRWAWVGRQTSIRVAIHRVNPCHQNRLKCIDFKYLIMYWHSGKCVFRWATCATGRTAALSTLQMTCLVTRALGPRNTLHYTGSVIKVYIRYITHKNKHIQKGISRCQNS